jgi:hypothetical protein
MESNQRSTDIQSELMKSLMDDAGMDDSEDQEMTDSSKEDENKFQTKVIDLDPTPPSAKCYQNYNSTILNMNDDAIQLPSMNSSRKSMDPNSIEYIVHDFDSLLLNSEEQKRATDSRYIFNFTSFPNSFKDPDEALDCYNTLGYKNSIQFKQYELKKEVGKILMFSLCCDRRDKARYHYRYHFQQNNIKISE